MSDPVRRRGASSNDIAVTGEHTVGIRNGCRSIGRDSDEIALDAIVLSTHAHALAVVAADEVRTARDDSADDVLAGELVDPLKTTVVQNQRCMTTWVLRKLR